MNNTRITQQELILLYSISPATIVRLRQLPEFPQRFKHPKNPVTFLRSEIDIFFNEKMSATPLKHGGEA